MRNTDQRVLAVKQRTMEINRKKQMQQSRMVGISAVALSLLFIAGLSFTMPSIMEGMSDDSYIYPGLTAGIFDTSGGLGYLLIALLAFALGVCVTILSYRIHHRNRELTDEEKKQELENNCGRAD